MKKQSYIQFEKEREKEIYTILNRLKPASKKALEKIKHSFFVVDVETNGLQATQDKFIFGCIYGFNYKFYFNTIDKYLEEIKKDRFKGCYIFAHNAEFDFTVLYGNIILNLDREAIFNGRFIFAKNEKRYFADSMNIFNTSVKNIGHSLGIEKMELATEYKEGTVIKITSEMIKYCFRDCEIVFKALLTIFELCEAVRPTLGGLSMIYYRKKFQPFSFCVNKTLSDEFFKSYYGGRVEAYKIGKTHSYKYDINSMYPYMMSKIDFPNPLNLKKVFNPSIDKLLYYLEYYEGLAEIEVFHIKTNSGFLPVRGENGKLLFPYGYLNGNWNFPEIRYALKNNIIKILKVNKIIFSEKMKTPFKEFAEENYNLRMKSKGIYNMVYKLLLNNLYGKFAERDKFKNVYLPEIDYYLLNELSKKGINFEVKMFSAERKDCYLTIMEKPKNKFHTIALFSSYITSEARIYLLSLMNKYKDYQLTYVDTDCICVEKEINKKSSLILGDFKKEEGIIKEIFGNKNYIEISKGELKRKTKGVSKYAKQINNDTFEVTKLVKTKEAIRRNIQAGTNIKVEKKLKNNYDKRTVLKNGKTKTLYVKQTKR